MVSVINDIGDVGHLLLLKWKVIFLLVNGNKLTKLNGKNELLIVVGVFSTIVILFATESQIQLTTR